MERATGVVKEFKEFLLRGNVVELAVAVVIATAFGVLVKAAVDYLLTPLIAAIFGKPDFSQLSFTINGSTFQYGAFINALIAFVLDRRRRLLRGRQALQRVAGASPEGRGGHDEGLPRVRERDPVRRAPLRVLHLPARVSTVVLRP